MEHPETYTLTREEWLAINRTLAGCALSLNLPRSNYAAGKREERLQRTRDAQDIMSDIYRRAEKES